MPGNQQIFSAAMNAADQHRWNSQWLEAAREYQKALAEFPEDAAARSGLGFCHMQTKQWQQALKEYEYVLKRDPSNVIALSKTAELYGILNQRDKAYSAYLHLADLYSQAGQGARAEAAWQKTVQLSPSDPEPHERLAGYYFEKKDISSMIQQRLAAAQGYLLKNDLGLAQAQCELVLRADNTNIQAQQLLTRILEGAHTPSGPLPHGAGAAYSTSIGSALQTEQVNLKPPAANGTSGPLAETTNFFSETMTSGNISGGNTGIMGNMGSAGNFGGVNQGPTPTMSGGVGGNNPRKRLSANQVTEALKQAQMFQDQGRFNDAIDLCEQILESGFDRPDARYFLGWLYQEQQRWDEAIRQFQLLLNDPDYALSCYYALGQCYRAGGDLRSATLHFDEAVDRVNLDALTLEESDQLVQLCQEAAEAHRMLGEQEQALTVYNALLGFLRSRGWNDKVAQVEFMLQQAQNAPIPQQPANSGSRPLASDQQQQRQQDSISEASTMMFNAASMQPVTQQPQQQPVQNNSATPSQSGDLPDWLTGILNEPEQTQKAPQKPITPAPQTVVQPPVQEVNQQAEAQAQQPVAPSWLTEDAKPTANATRSLPPEQTFTAEPTIQQQPQQSMPTIAQSQPQQSMPTISQSQPVQVPPVSQPLPQPVEPTPAPKINSQQLADDALLTVPPPSNSRPVQSTSVEDLLSQIAGANNGLANAAEPVLASTASLPENVRTQVVRSMQDIQKYINHGLLTSATEECLRVIDMAPQYLDVHQVLCEIYVRQGKIEQAITKYAILVDTYIVNNRTDDAITTYRRILQLEPNNLKYRMRLIELFSAQGNKEDLLRERTLAAESYLRLGYMDRALTELEQALKESPTSVPTRLNYALALQKLGRTQQAVAEYQRVLQIDPRNITALVRWHIAMVTGSGASRSTSLEILTRIRWQLRGEGQKSAGAVIREYQQALEIYPNNADLYFAVGQIYHQAGQFDQAVDAYLQAASRDNSVEVLARASAAQCFFTQGRPDRVIEQLEQALQTVRRTPTAVDPSTWAARPREEGEEHKAPEMELSLQLAKAYERTGRHDQKEAIMRQLKQTRPVSDEVSSAMSQIASRQGDMHSALQEHLDLVRHYRNNRQTDNAINVLNEMVRMAPQDPRAHEELADIYINRGLLDDGIAELRLLADIYIRRGQMSQAGEVVQRMGNIYADMGNTDEAYAALCRAAELNPESMDLLREVVGFCMQLNRDKEAARYQTIIARYYFETHQVKESVAALQQLIAIDRGNLEAYDMLGQTYESVGEYEQASRVYRNLAKVNPGNNTARERLATLQQMRSNS